LSHALDVPRLGAQSSQREREGGERKKVISGISWQHALLLCRSHTFIPRWENGGFREWLSLYFCIAGCIIQLINIAAWAAQNLTNHGRCFHPDDSETRFAALISHNLCVSPVDRCVCFWAGGLSLLLCAGGSTFFSPFPPSRVFFRVPCENIEQ